jgi:hypothetical protein
MKRKAIREGLLVSVSCLLLAGVTGCKYDVATPKYYDKFVNPLTPTITGLIPQDEAGGGVNAITINGENFASGADSNKVYFGTFNTEVISATPTAIVVRRPNVTGPVTVKVVPYDAIEVARYSSPYMVDTVITTYGGFMQNIQLQAVAVDNEENVYVCYADRTMFKIPSGGETTAIGHSGRVVTGMAIGNDGLLYLFANNASISRMNPADGTDTDWIKLGTKKVSFGDFDRNGILYAGGKNSDLFVIQSDGTFAALGVYATSDIRAVHVYNGYVYVAVAGTGNVWSVFKHQILDANGKLGDKQPVLDQAASGVYSQSAFKDMVFSQDGTLYVATNYEQPILMINPDQSQDILYKYIIPSNPGPVMLAWGSGNYLYSIIGSQTPQPNWKLYRIDMGTKKGEH